MPTPPTPRWPTRHPGSINPPQPSTTTGATSATRPAHVIARMLVESLSVNDLYAPGSGDSFAFLLDMNRGLEDFITQVLMDAFRDSDVRVRAQRRDGTLITDARDRQALRGGTSSRTSCSSPAPPPVRRVPVDAKYKLYDERKINQATSTRRSSTRGPTRRRGRDRGERARVLGTRARPALREAHLRAQTHAQGRGASIRAIPVGGPTSGADRCGGAGNDCGDRLTPFSELGTLDPDGGHAHSFWSPWES